MNKYKILAEVISTFLLIAILITVVSLMSMNFRQKAEIEASRLLLCLDIADKAGLDPNDGKPNFLQVCMDEEPLPDKLLTNNPN